LSGMESRRTVTYVLNWLSARSHWWGLLHPRRSWRVRELTPLWGGAGRGAHEHAVHSDGGADGAGRPGGVDAHARPAIRSDGIQQAALWRDAGPDVRGGGCWVDRMRVQETRQRWSADEFSSSSSAPWRAAERRRPPHMPREDGLAHPADTSRTNALHF
jgi:hypothetical protein